MPSSLRYFWRATKTFLVIISIAVGLGTSGVVRPTTRSANTTVQQLKDKPQEKPVPFEPTKENEGKRCEAKTYFGLRRDGSSEGYTAFCYKLQLKLITAAREGNLPAIRETLRFGANINLPVDDSFASLQTAAASGHADTVRLLLDNGAQVNHVSDFENTPLNAAAADGHLEVVQVLLERGADACYKSAGGTAGDIARSRGYKEVAELLKSAESAKCK